LIPAEPSYRTSHVYGNLLYEYADDGNRQMVHYGGDSGTTGQYRKGTLQLYNNTFVSVRTDRTTLVRLSTNEETVDARNNIFYTTAPGTTVSLGDASGIYYLSRNWIKPGWVNSFGPFSGVVNNDGTSVNGTSPGFVDEAGRDYHLTASSACVNTGGNLNGAVLPLHNVIQQYVKHQSTEPRAVNGLFDIGAYELAGGTPANQPPIAALTATPVSGYVPLTVTFSATGSYDPDGTIASYAWEFGNGGTGSGVAPTLTYNGTGTFTALLRVTDNAGATSSVTRTIQVNGLPAPALTGKVSGSTVNLNWTNAAGSSVTGFRVERRTQGGNSTWVVVANVTGTSFSETRSRGSWSYRVRGSNSVALSPYSNTVTLKVK
jgi:PKD repeat protein